jgi:hypothetical protein
MRRPAHRPPVPTAEARPAGRRRPPPGGGRRRRSSRAPRPRRRRCRAGTPGTAGRSAAFTTVVTMRSYSRTSGDTSCEQVTSWPCSRRCGRHQLLVGGSRSAWRRHTATPGGAAGDGGHCVRSSRSSSWPSAPSRPPTSSRHSGGPTAPVAPSTCRTGRVGPAGRSRRRRARPSVVMSATGAVLPSSSALVATVVPWASASGRLPTRLPRRRAARARDRRAWTAPWSPCRRPPRRR